MSGGGKGKQVVTQRTEIPKFLQPFIKQATSTGSGALGSLSNMLTPGTSLVAGFDPLQTQGQQGLIDFAGGAGGFLPTATDALSSTARGDFLYGGPGFDEAVQASIRAAQPNILSSFGAAGRGVSGLGQAAVQRAASDAFAGLFDQERSRQLNAASLLPEIGMIAPNILSSIGGQRQAQAQRELEGPVAAQERLLNSSLGVTPSQSSLFGQSQTTPGADPLSNILGIGLSLAGMASGIPGAGKAGGMLGSGKGGGGFVGSGGIPIPGRNPFFS